MPSEVQDAPSKVSDTQGSAKGNMDSIRSQGNDADAGKIIDSMTKGNAGTSEIFPASASLPWERTDYLYPGFGIEEPSKTPAPEKDANAPQAAANPAEAPAKPSEAPANPAEAPANPTEAPASPTEAPAGKDSGSAQRDPGDGSPKGNANDQPGQGNQATGELEKDALNPDAPAVLHPFERSATDRDPNIISTGAPEGNDGSAQPGQGNQATGEWEPDASKPGAPAVWQAFERSATDRDPNIISTGAPEGNDGSAQPGQGNQATGEWEPDASKPGAPAVWQAFERSATDRDPNIISTGAPEGNDGSAQPGQGNPDDGQTNGKANDQTNGKANDQVAQANPGDVQPIGIGNDQSAQTNAENDQTKQNANDQQTKDNSASTFDWDALNPQAPPVQYTHEPDANGWALAPG